ncbi:MAG TPA: pyridoxamine 5'-phosphate oxidase family protein [Candidatus Acidoferrales bacterium]|nr:pyridoxamine 5'-phosphate oxidase family protein [Candidatus Acidoferrales bacterium]
MGKPCTEIDETTRRFIEAQRVFFVGSAPLDRNGHVNVSPKGLDTLRILDPRTVAYLDLTGSGVETIAHAKENGRVTLMFCSFEGPPKILRLYGRSSVVEPHQREFESLRGRFPDYPGARAIIVIALSRVADSCGYAVPILHYEKEREQLAAWTRNRGPQGLETYRREKNRSSIDALPGLTDA